MSNDSRVAFPNRIRALIADSDAGFVRSACLMLSLLNFRVATCETPASAVKLLSGRLKDADVVFIDALRATTCGFDFRGIVERHLCIPVVYFFSFDYNVAGDVVEALRRNVWAATYVIKKPALDVEDLCRLWRIIQWSQIMLRRGERTLSWLEWPRGNRALPAAVHALLPISSTSEDQGEEDVDGHKHFQVVLAGRGRRRKLGDCHDGGSSSRGHGGGSSGRGRGRGRGGVAVRGQPTRRLAEQMNVTEGQESDDDDVVPSYQQPAQQNRRGVQAMGVQSQQHGRSLFMQPVPQMLNVPHNNPMISVDAAGPSSSNVAAFSGVSKTSAPALLPLPVYQAPARVVPSHQQPAQHNIQTAMCVQNQQHGRSLLMQPVPQMLTVSRNADAAGPSNSNVTAFAGASNISAPAQLPAYQAPTTSSSVPRLVYSAQATAPEQPPPVYQQQQPMSLYNFGNMVAPPAPAPTMAATSGHQLQQDMFVQRRQDSSMGQLRETGPMSLARDELAVMQAAMINGNGDMATMFPSDDENAMLSLDPLWDFSDDFPMDPEGQQAAATNSTAATNTTGTKSNSGASGGLGPNLNIGADDDDGLDILEEYLKDESASDLLLPQDMNNGHQ